LLTSFKPALLYLSPACILSVLITGAIRGELESVWAFSETEEDEKLRLKQENEGTGSEQDKIQTAKSVSPRKSRKKD